MKKHPGHKPKSKHKSKPKPKPESKPEFRPRVTPSPKWHVSLSDLVEFYGAPHDSTIKAQMKIEGFPADCKIKHGIYDLKKYNDWRIDHFYGDENTKTTMAAERLRYQKARADREEMTVEKARGNLLDRGQLLQNFSIVLAGLRNRFLCWYKTQPPMLVGKDEKQMGMVLRIETRALLADLAEGIKSVLPKKKRKKKK